MKKIKIRGPRTDHCGIPLLLSAQSLYEKLIFVLCLINLSNLLTKLRLCKWNLSGPYMLQVSLLKVHETSSHEVFKRSISIAATKPELSSSTKSI